MTREQRQVLLEVCVDSLEGAMTADRCGADRIELCSSLLEGGLTPSYGLMKLVRQAVKCRMHVMIRPRGGDFLYNQTELQVMMEDARSAANLGVDGLVMGILNADGTVDCPTLMPFVKFCKLKNLDLTFHRAFDMVADQRAALDALIECKVPRVLTSGGMPSAIQGAQRMMKLVEEAKGRITVIAAGGVRLNNVRELLNAAGVTEVHSSASRRIDSGMRHRPILSMCSSSPPSDWHWGATDQPALEGLVQGLAAWREENQ